MDWTFEQLEGLPFERKKLVLSGYNAPFGRPRRDPIAKELIKSRIQTTRYPGSAATSRHAFGTNYEPMELKGRWMTKTSDVKTTAQDFANDFRLFVKDERTCRISWGNVISWIGYIEELELAHESQHEIAWRMKIQIDRRDADQPFVNRKPQVSIPTGFGMLLGLWVGLGKLQTPIEGKLSSDFFDSLDALAGLFNVPAAIAAKIAGQFDDIEKKSFATLQHFLGALSNMRTVISQFRDTVLNAQVDAAIFARSAESDVDWSEYQTAVDTETTDMLYIISQLERTAELEEKDEPKALVTAKQGDTWESISTRATGDPSRAADIRAFNGIKYGELPRAGETYLIP